MKHESITILKMDLATDIPSYCLELYDSSMFWCVNADLLCKTRLLLSQVHVTVQAQQAGQCDGCTELYQRPSPLLPGESLHKAPPARYRYF